MVLMFSGWSVSCGFGVFRVVCFMWFWCFQGGLFHVVLVFSGWSVSCGFSVFRVVCFMWF